MGMRAGHAGVVGDDGSEADPGGEPVSGVHLEADETASLDAASDPAPADYPYGGPGNEQRSRLISGGR